MAMDNQLTKEGLEKLKEELEHLMVVKRKEVAEKLNYAISFGDLSENAAYDDARNEQSFVEARILELQDIISKSSVIDFPQKGGKIRVGSSVIVEVDGKNETFTIVGPEEADIINGKLSYKSPLGEMLFGREEGDKVQFQSPGGIMEYKVVKVE